MSTNIQIVRLTNGELMISDLQNEGDKYSLLKPLQIATYPDDKGQPQVMLVDMNGQLGKSDVLEIEKRNVLYKFEPSDELAESYLRNITPEENRIVVPDPSVDLSSLTS